MSQRQSPCFATANPKYSSAQQSNYRRYTVTLYMYIKDSSKVSMLATKFVVCSVAYALVYDLHWETLNNFWNENKKETMA